MENYKPSKKDVFVQCVLFPDLDREYAESGGAYISVEMRFVGKHEQLKRFTMFPNCKNLMSLENLKRFAKKEGKELYSVVCKIGPCGKQETFFNWRQGDYRPYQP